jgi:hypothetical protein
MKFWQSVRNLFQELHRFRRLNDPLPFRTGEGVGDFNGKRIRGD